MKKVTLDKVLEEVKALNPDEQRQLQELLNTVLENSHSPPTEEEFECILLRMGIISEIPPQIADVESYRNYKPVEVKGKPVSETIIEERR